MEPKLIDNRSIDKPKVVFGRKVVTCLGNIKFCDMKSNKLKRAIIFVVLVIGIYCLTINFTDNPDRDFANESNNKISDPQIMARHLTMPSKYSGKQLPFHHIYESRRVGYSNDLQVKNVSSSKTKLILLWTPWNGVQKTINYYSLRLGDTSFVKYNCPHQKCTTSRDRKDMDIADAVVFHLLDTKSSDLPSYRNAQQLWILYNMEPPWLIRKHKYPELPRLKNVFNWTMSYRTDSELTAKYGFVMRSQKEPTTTHVPFHQKKKNAVWFVSDCLTDSRREDYVNELRKHIDVDIYGTCGDLKCYPSQSTVCYEKVLADYKFYLSFENGICKDYVTEKFYNAFNYDIIPVIFGATNYSMVAPEGTFIDATRYSNPKELASVLLKIGGNEKLYESFIIKKSLYEAYLDPWMCRLCEKLHSVNKPSVVEDLERFWLTEANCQTWNKNNKMFERSTNIVSSQIINSPKNYLLLITLILTLTFWQMTRFEKER